MCNGIRIQKDISFRFCFGLRDIEFIINVTTNLGTDIDIDCVDYFRKDNWLHFHL